MALARARAWALGVLAGISMSSTARGRGRGGPAGGRGYGRARARGRTSEQQRLAQREQERLWRLQNLAAAEATEAEAAGDEPAASAEPTVPAAAAATAAAAAIPGYVFDAGRKRFFKIVRDSHATDVSQAHSRSAVRDRSTQAANLASLSTLQAQTKTQIRLASRQIPTASYSSMPLFLHDRELGQRPAEPATVSASRAWDTMFSKLRLQCRLTLNASDGQLTPHLSPLSRSTPVLDSPHSPAASRHMRARRSSWQARLLQQPSPTSPAVSPSRPSTPTVSVPAQLASQPSPQSPSATLSISSFRINTVSRTLALCRSDGTVRAYQLERDPQHDTFVPSLTARPRLVGRHQSQVSSVLVETWDTTQIIAVTTLGTELTSGELCIYASPSDQQPDSAHSRQSDSLREQRFTPRKTVSMWSCTMQPAGSRALAIAGASGVTYVLSNWEHAITAVQFLSMPTKSDVFSLAFDSDHVHMLYSGTRGGGIYGYDLRAYSGVRPARELIAPTSAGPHLPPSPITSLVSLGSHACQPGGGASVAGGVVLSARLDGQIVVWDMRWTGSPLMVLGGASNSSRSVHLDVAVAPTASPVFDDDHVPSGETVPGAVVLAATDDGWFRSWSLVTGNLLCAWQTGALPGAIGGAVQWDGGCGAWVSDGDSVSHYTSIV
ncbi:hypothetical protein BC831DRAFT_274604 [Entophlyctis helioformis]|nr:hypothetical protein BC831DRAFT_274604 [Entophlyctis helioformis]